MKRQSSKQQTSIPTKGVQEATGLDVKSTPVTQEKPVLQSETIKNSVCTKIRTGPFSPYAKMYLSTPLERIKLIRGGVPATELVQTGEAMGVSKERLFTLLRFARATVNRRIKEKQTLPADYSERIIGLQKLVGQVEVMVAESGNPVGFDAARWVANWLDCPVPALNNVKPADFMDTIEGQKLVSSLLAQTLSGAYA